MIPVCKSLIGRRDSPRVIDQTFAKRAAEMAEGLPCQTTVIGHHSHTDNSQTDEYTTTVLVSDGTFRVYHAEPRTLSDGVCLGWSIVVEGCEPQGTTWTEFMNGEIPRSVLSDSEKLEAVEKWFAARVRAGFAEPEEGKSV